MRFVFTNKCSVSRIFAIPGIVFTAGGKGGAVAGRRGAGRAGRGLPALLLLALLAPTRADVIFRVPEVVVRHAATAKAVGSGGLNKTAGIEGARESQGLIEVRYEEYFVEHDVSTSDARLAAHNLDLDEYLDETALLLKRRDNPLLGIRIGCGECTKRELEYCETRVLADHCCCERGANREPFPWLPHTCYTGPEPCRPLARDCAHYTRLRDCCCYHQLARRWKGILLKSGQNRVSLGFCWVLPLASLVRAYY